MKLHTAIGSIAISFGLHFRGGSAVPCCSWNYKNCSPQPSWCDESKENCLGDACGGKVYLEGPFTPQTENCKGLGEACYDDSDCCLGYMYFADTQRIPWLQQKLQYCKEGLVGDDGVEYRGCSDIPYEYCCSWQRHVDRCQRQSPWCHVSAENCQECLGGEPGGYIPNTDAYKNCSRRQRGCKTHDECCGNMTCQWINDPAILSSYDFPYFGCEDPINGGTSSDNSGSDNSGSDNSGSDNSGSDNSGSDNDGSCIPQYGEIAYLVVSWPDNRWLTGGPGTGNEAKTREANPDPSYQWIIRSEFGDGSRTYPDAKAGECIRYGDSVVLQVNNVDDRWLGGCGDADYYPNPSQQGVHTKDVATDNSGVEAFKWVIRSTAGSLANRVLPDDVDPRNGDCLTYGDTIFMQSRCTDSRWLSGGRSAENIVVVTRDVYSSWYNNYEWSVLDNYQWVVRMEFGDGSPSYDEGC